MSSISMSGGETLSDAELQKVIDGLPEWKAEDQGNVTSFKIILMCFMFLECWLGLLPGACGMCMKN